MEEALLSEPHASRTRYRENPAEARVRDAAAGRTLDGRIHRSAGDLRAKNMPARDASTGEQKALLMGWCSPFRPRCGDDRDHPLLLLDEVVAISIHRRAALFGELASSARSLADRRGPRGVH